jgi:hypothetical protein
MVYTFSGANSFDTTTTNTRSGDTLGYHGGAVGDGWLKTTRARLNFDARSDTEWGTLRGFIRLQANWGTPIDGPVAVDQGYIHLGGLMMGCSESFWADSKNGGPFNYGSHSWGGMYYGYQQRHLIGYRYNGPNGFFAAVSLEDDTLNGDGYMPDFVGTVPLTLRAQAAVNVPRNGLKGPFSMLTQVQFRAIWNDAKATVGLGADKEVVPHILRHTCASRLVRGGIDIRRVQMWLGHQTLTMTMRYAHLATNDLDTCVKVLERDARAA